MHKFDNTIGKSTNVIKRNVVFLDDNDRVTDKKNAKKIIITEYDKDGHVINEIFGQYNNKTEEEERDR